jgi:threonine dehydrogenase-like Zn-dependent dehydrogenase
VGIIGSGSIDMLHIQAFKSAGASIVIMIGLNQDAKRFEIAKKLGLEAFHQGDSVRVLFEI